ncbi:hypothetical protein HOT33_gp075 [Escherichia phage Gostya9]|uniref:Uncharacterized protein n=1 Tax=Escherichia phage Gostya9 TaxID=2182345 RepID=A0A2U8UX35_9CAUD|nr:hypothetical protein HOT33_gp075 [Escherichia phage Gostya9]AWN08770.1 hypothetical protein T59_0121c [Escherichia phage Gostya9]
MSDTTLLPTNLGGDGFGGEAGAAGIGGAIGGLIGSWIGNGLGGRGNFAEELKAFVNKLVNIENLA